MKYDEDEKMMIGCCGSAHTLLELRTFVATVQRAFNRVSPFLDFVSPSLSSVALLLSTDAAA